MKGVKGAAEVAGAKLRPLQDNSEANSNKKSKAEKIGEKNSMN